MRAPLPATILLSFLPLFVFAAQLYRVPVLTSIWKSASGRCRGFEMERTWTLDHYRRVLENPLFLGTIAPYGWKVAIVLLER